MHYHLISNVKFQQRSEATPYLGARSVVENHVATERLYFCLNLSISSCFTCFDSKYLCLLTFERLGFCVIRYSIAIKIVTDAALT